MPEGALPVASAGREDATCLALAHHVCPQPPGPQPVFPGAPPMGLARGQLLDPVATRGGLLRVSKKKKICRVSCLIIFAYNAMIILSCYNCSLYHFLPSVYCRDLVQN